MLEFKCVSTRHHKNSKKKKQQLQFVFKLKSLFNNIINQLIHKWVKVFNNRMVGMYSEIYLEGPKFFFSGHHKNL